MDKVLAFLAKNPDLLKVVLPLLSSPVVLGLIGKFLGGGPAQPAPVVAPVPPLVIYPTSPATPPVVLGAPDRPTVLMTGIKCLIDASWHNWYNRGDEGEEGKASPARIQRILDGIEDAPPGSHWLLSVVSEPENVYPVPMGKFVWHVEVCDENGALIEHIKCLGPEKYEGNYVPYLRTVPRRWYNHETGEVSGWNLMMKLIPWGGAASAPDRRLRWWVEYPERGLASEKTDISWRKNKPSSVPQ
jgi:hypothetical protein